MCELFGLSSNLPVTASFSLEAFALHGGDTGPHRDGWGIAYFENGDVRLIKEAEPAANSDWVNFIERHHLRSRIVLSHIRKATQGSISFANTQPFIRELGGRMHVFAHNGNLVGIERVETLSYQHYRPVGETDSEHAFCALLERLSELWLNISGVPSLAQRFQIVCQFASEIGPLGPANFLYADGDTLFAHGNKRTQTASGKLAPPGLFRLCRQCVPESVFDVPGLCLDGHDQHVVLVASVPLSGEDWVPLDEGEVLCLQNGKVILPAA
ncbi:MAG: class II glutamine amidotransferase [Alphaproteobacteria bacterium]